MDADLDTLATALYVKIDDLLIDSPERAPWRPRVGIVPRISDAELVTLAVMQALLRSPARPGGYVRGCTVEGVELLQAPNQRRRDASITHEPA